MKTKLIKSPGSLIVRGSNYYAFWQHNGKAICRTLRDDNGTAVTTRPESEKAIARLLELVNKENEAKTKRSIQRAIGDKQAEIDTWSLGLTHLAGVQSFAVGGVLPYQPAADCLFLRLDRILACA